MQKFPTIQPGLMATPIKKSTWYKQYLCSTTYACIHLYFNVSSTRIYIQVWCGIELLAECIDPQHCVGSFECCVCEHKWYYFVCKVVVNYFIVIACPIPNFFCVHQYPLPWCCILFSCTYMYTISENAATPTNIPLSTMLQNLLSKSLNCTLICSKTSAFRKWFMSSCASIY